MHPGYPEARTRVLLVELDGVAVAGRGGPRRGRGDLPRLRAPGRSGPPPTTPSARCSGRGASRPSRPWAGSPTTTTSRTASCRGRSCPRCCADRRARGGVRPARRQRLPRRRRQPAPARALRRARRGRAGAGAGSWPRRSSRRASTRAARSPASTGSGRTRPARCRCSSARTTSRRCSGCARAFDPAGLCNPGKVFPTPRLCGEVPGPYRAHPLEKAGLAERL